MNPSRTFLVTLLLVSVAALAGCTDDEPDLLDNPYDSFEAALDAPGTLLEPQDENQTIKMKLLSPKIAGAATGTQRVIVLLYDTEQSDPITTATVRLAAEMPAMGHGTSNEIHPEHVGFGVYIGQTDLFMPGQWEIRFDAFGARGLDETYLAPIEVTGDGGAMDGMDHGEHGE